MADDNFSKQGKKPSKQETWEKLVNPLGSTGGEPTYDSLDFAKVR